jgi:sulfur carrier protein
MITIAVNGTSHQVPAGTTIAELLEILGVDRNQIAVERNRDIVARRRYDEVVLDTGDRVEVVSFVGGG